MKTRSFKIIFGQAAFLAVISLAAFGFAAKADHLTSTVLENPYNRLAAQLDNKSQELSKKELALNSLEAKLEKSYFQVFVLVGFLFMLIVTNFILDYKRRRSLINKL